MTQGKEKMYNALLYLKFSIERRDYKPIDIAHFSDIERLSLNVLLRSRTPHLI